MLESNHPYYCFTELPQEVHEHLLRTQGRIALQYPPQKELELTELEKEILRRRFHIRAPPLEPTDLSYTKYYRITRKRNGQLERIFLCADDKHPDKSEDIRQIEAAMLERYDFVCVEHVFTRSDFLHGIWLGNFTRWVCLGNCYVSSVCVFFWPHLRWTWTPWFYMASFAFFIWNAIYTRYVALHYQDDDDEDLMDTMPIYRCYNRKVRVFKYSPAYWQGLYLFGVYAWVFYNWAFYTRWPYPLTLCEWDCMAYLSDFARKYKFWTPLETIWDGFKATLKRQYHPKLHYYPIDKFNPVDPRTF